MQIKDTITSWLQGKNLGVFLVFILLCLAPMFLSDFRVNLLGKFVAFAILALGIDLIWGYTGILSLGHGVFFGLGGYCMAMYMKLTASGGKLPDFMSWSGLQKLPWFWTPFSSAPFALAMTILVPVILALLVGALTFRNRIQGVYFSILTQALTIVFVTLFIGQQPYTGGTNGITNLKAIFGYPLASHATKMGLYYVSILILLLAYLLCRLIVNRRIGKVLVAIRDGENRLRFSGYNPAVYKVFVFCISAALAGIAGAVYVPQVGIISPAAMGIVPSVEMVIWVAIGGRGTLLGAIIGAILVNSLKSAFSESFPDIWSYFIGLAFIAVVLFMPNGLVGIYQQMKSKYGQTKRTEDDAVDQMTFETAHKVNS